MEIRFWLACSVTSKLGLSTLIYFGSICFFQAESDVSKGRYQYKAVDSRVIESDNLQKMVQSILWGSPTITPNHLIKDSTPRITFDTCIMCKRKRINDWYCYNHTKKHHKRCCLSVYYDRDEFYVVTTQVDDIDIKTKIRKFNQSIRDSLI